MLRYRIIYRRNGQLDSWYLITIWMALVRSDRNQISVDKRTPETLRRFFSHFSSSSCRKRRAEGRSFVRSTAALHESRTVMFWYSFRSSLNWDGSDYFWPALCWVWSTQVIQARFSFKRNRLRCMRCENRKKRKRLRWQAANRGCHCFDRAFLLADRYGWSLLRRIRIFLSFSIV